MQIKRSFLPSALAIGILFVAFNLRAPITGIGPIIHILKDYFNLSGGTGGLLTTLPLLAFAAVSPFVAQFSKKYGYGMVMFAGLILLLVGELIRSYTGIAGLFAGTLLLGVGIGIGNVLLPSIIKKEFVLHTGLMLGLYTLSLNIFASISAGASAPLTERMGWRNSLAVWIPLVLITLFIWLPQVFKRNHSASEPEKVILVNDKGLSIWKSMLAWWVTLYMGIQSFIFYGLTAWLPSVMISKGLSAEAAGNMTFLFQIAGLPTSLIIPSIAYKCKGQQTLTIINGLILISGLIFLIVSSSLWHYILAVTLVGLACGANLSLAISFISLRVSTSRKATELSGMSQSVGYILAAISPVLMGVVHDWTLNWALALGILVIASGMLWLIGFKAAGDVVIKS
ncbi:MAG TPA: MFS transporter [Porphyromonadaceae bacterium]|jgi:CP family cyanate transporter-like MFS transporter|nr:MFS transporter [Porphyromonadaceae bacterium]HBL33621.1 MFS transporter [Porphyromonadaceae bacterium]HBX21304.1 MFS transporter [Porphyromonadaceae bacterium]HCM20249.1 MFS transporter [Porphyromonadaceae bacterium]